MGHTFHCRTATPSATSPQSTSTSGSASIPTSTSTSKTSPRDVAWHKKMLEKVTALEEKYGDQYSPWKDEDGIIHSAKVMIPKVDFSMVKPSILRALPKPGNFPLHGCSPDPNFYHKCIDTMAGRRPKFDCPMPFGSKAAFETNLGLTSVPEEPIGGFVYKSGSNDSTVW